MKTIQVAEGVRLRGDLTLVMRHVASGRETRLHVRNTITYAGLQSPLYLWAQDGVTLSNYQITRLVPGRTATPPTRGDTGVLDPVAEADQIPLVGINRAVDPVRHELTITGTLGVDQANGSTLCEIGLVMSNGDLFARQIHPNFSKTNAFTLTYTWRIALSA